MFLTDEYYDLFSIEIDEVSSEHLIITINNKSITYCVVHSHQIEIKCRSISYIIILCVLQQLKNVEVSFKDFTYTASRMNQPMRRKLFKTYPQSHPHYIFKLVTYITVHTNSSAFKTYTPIA